MTQQAETRDMLDAIHLILKLPSSYSYCSLCFVLSILLILRSKTTQGYTETNKLVLKWRPFGKVYCTLPIMIFV